MLSSWPGAKQIRAAFGFPREGVKESKQRITVTIDLAAPGTQERFLQLRNLTREFDAMTVVARREYQDASSF